MKGLDSRRNQGGIESKERRSLRLGLQNLVIGSSPGSWLVSGGCGRGIGRREDDPISELECAGEDEGGEVGVLWLSESGNAR